MKKIANMFRTPDGTNYAFTFVLICSLFLLWGLCNGMIDVLNKHFQNSLNVTKAQSALVQFANYMGYFFMAIPAGLLARRFGYKGGIIVGLALIAAGAFWFIPATRIGTYWAFLTGLFILATGLTCLETIANPYTTVLGSPEMGAARINLAQTTNGIGWILGPLVCGWFTLSTTEEINRSNESLYKPYLLVGVIVTILLVVFLFAKVPDLNAEEECQAENGKSKQKPVKPLWQRWHFVLAVAAQFLYVAAQTGIFSFFINYAVTDMPVMSQQVARANKLTTKLTYPAAMFAPNDIQVKEITSLTAKLQNDSDAKTRPVTQFLWSQFSTNTIALLQTTDPDLKSLHKKQAAALDSEFNRILQTNSLYDASRFAGVALSDETRKLIDQNPQGELLARLNRRLLEATFAEKEIARSPHLQSPLFRITERGASFLLSFGGFGLFLLGRFTGSIALSMFKAHTTLTLYCVINTLMMALVVFPLRWVSVVGLFLSFFFMSIMFPTIFALGIRGLGEQTKMASSLIVMAIVGGAVMPMFMGWLADTYSMSIGFVMPLICFAGIAAYAASWRWLEEKDSGAAGGPVQVVPGH
jgi:fucose permease